MGVVQEEVFAMGFRSFTLNGCREFRGEHPERFSRINLVTVLVSLALASTTCCRARWGPVRGWSKTYVKPCDHPDWDPIRDGRGCLVRRSQSG